MDDKSLIITSGIILFLMGIIISIFIIIHTTYTLVPYKTIIDSGCGYYNSDKELVIKDECKKYYGIKEDKK